MVNRRSNLLTSRFGYFGTWNSRWVGENTTYSDLLHQDFKVISFLNGLFRKLRIPTSKFHIARYSLRVVAIESDLYVIRPFWVVYSHIDRVFENAYVYYVCRLFFKMPKLLLRAKVHFCTRPAYKLTERLNTIRTSRKYIVSIESGFPRNGKEREKASSGCFRTPFNLRSDWSRAIFMSFRTGLLDSGITNEKLVRYPVLFDKLIVITKGGCKSEVSSFLFYVDMLLRVQSFLVFRRIRKTARIRFFLQTLRRCLKASSRYVLRTGIFLFGRILRRVLLAGTRSTLASVPFNALHKAALAVHVFLFGKQRHHFITKGKYWYTQMVLHAFRKRFTLKLAAAYLKRIRLLLRFVRAIRLLCMVCLKIRIASIRSIVQYRLITRFSNSFFLVSLISSVMYAARSGFISSSLLYSGVLLYVGSVIKIVSISNVSMYVRSLFRKIEHINYSFRRLLSFVFRLRAYHQALVLYYLLIGMFASVVAFGRSVFCLSLYRQLSFNLSGLLTAMHNLYTRYRVTLAFWSNNIVLLGQLLNVSINVVKASVLSRRFALRTYHANIRGLIKVGYLLRSLKRTNLGVFLFASKRFIHPTTGIMKIGRSKNGSLSTFFKAQRLTGFHLYGSINKKRLFNRLFVAHRIIHSLISIKWFRLSVDKLIQNIEFTLSNYFNASVVFLPRIYKERPKKKYWAHTALKHAIRRSTQWSVRYKRVRNKLCFLRRAGMKNVLRLDRVKLFTRSPILRSLVGHLAVGFRRFFVLRRAKRVKDRRIHLRRKYRLVRANWFRKRKLLLNAEQLKYRATKLRRRIIYLRYPYILFKYRILNRMFKRKKFMRMDKFHKKWPMKYSRNMIPFIRSRNRDAGPIARSRFPPIADAKLICDYVVHNLNRGLRVYRVFSNIRYWQKREHRLTNALRHTAWIDSGMLTKKYPLSGIRILCAGSHKKGARKRRNNYHLWVRNQRLTRTMPLQEIEVDIDYFASNTHATTGTVGVKVWLCFSTISYRYRSRRAIYSI